MDINNHTCTDLKKSLPNLACLIREALLAGDQANEEQLKILTDYKKEFQWVNNLLFDDRFLLRNEKSKKPSLFLIK